MPCKAYCVYKNHRWKITKDSVEIVLHAAEEQGKKEEEPVKMGHVQGHKQAWALNEDQVTCRNGGRLRWQRAGEKHGD